MPQFVVWAVSAIGGYIGGTAGAFMIMYAAEIAFGVMLLGTAALSMSQQRKAQKKQRDAYNASQVDRMQNVVTTIGQRELVLGRVRKAGTVFARASTGTNKEKFCMALALAGHEIDAVETVYFNDLPVTLDIDGNVTSEPYYISRKESAINTSFTGPTIVLPGVLVADSITVTRTTGTGMDQSTAIISHSLVGNTVTIGDSDPAEISYQTTIYTSKAQVRTYLGTAGQTADAELIALFPGSWTTDHRARGVAYLVVEFDYDETAFTSGIPAVSAIIRGAKVYDPRDASTAWSENPALLARHVLTHESFGKRTSLTAAEDARIAAAANACDTSTGYVVDGVTTTRELFTAGYVVPYGSPAKDCLDDICQAMGGMWAYAGGEFFIRAGVYTAPVLALTEADLAVVKRGADGSVQQQPIVISSHKARADKVNVITPRIWDEAQAYKQVALTPLAPAALIARDGAWLAHELDMPAVTYSPQALHVAGIIIRDDRDSVRVTLPFKLKAYPVELFDVISLTIARYGWSSKAFIVLGRTWTLDGLIQLTLKETAAAIYQLDAAFDPQGYAENTNLPRPWDIDPPANVVITSGTSDLLRQEDGTITVRVKVAWDAITDQSLLYGGSIEIRYRLAVEADWHTITVPAAETFLYILGAKAGDVGFLQARCRNSIAVSDWTVQQSHTVAGKSDAPDVVTSLAATGIVGGIRLTGVLPVDTDLAYIEVWMGTTSTLGAASKVAEGLSDVHDQMGLSAADGARYFWVRTVDTSGNFGAYTGPVSATAGVTMGDVTGLSATGIAEGIRIAGTLPSNPDLAYVEVWMGTTSTLGAASLITRGLAASYDKLGLTVADGARYFWVRCVSTSAVAGNYVGPVSATAGQTVGDVTGLAATAIAGGIRLTGTLPSNPDLAGVQVWMHTTSTLGSASVVATGLVSTYDQMGLLPADGARYFWVRCFNASGNFGNYVGPVNATALSSMSSTGSRPALKGYGAAYSLSSSSWSNNKANRIISNMLTGATGTTDLATTTHLVTGDAVTLTNNSTFVQTKIWDGSSWTAGSTVVEGNVLVNGDGDFTGNLAIGGTAEIDGTATSTTDGAGTLVVNASYGGDYGVISYANTSAAVYGLGGYTAHGVYGTALLGSGCGVSGFTTGSGATGSGVWGVAGHANNEAGVKATGASSTTTALYISQGKFKWKTFSWTEPPNTGYKYLRDDGTWGGALPTTTVTTGYDLQGTQTPGSGVATFSGTAKPGGNSTNAWIKVVIGGTTYYIPVWT